MVANIAKSSFNISTEANEFEQRTVTFTESNTETMRQQLQKLNVA